MLKPLPHFHDRDNCEDEASSDSDDENSGAVSNPDDNDGQNNKFRQALSFSWRLTLTSLSAPEHTPALSIFRESHIRICKNFNNCSAIFDNSRRACHAVGKDRFIRTCVCICP